MFTVSRVFTNENGNEIDMSVTIGENGVLVDVEGPDSRIEHVWTELEMEQMFDLFRIARTSRFMKPM